MHNVEGFVELCPLQFCANCFSLFFWCWILNTERGSRWIFHLDVYSAQTVQNCRLEMEAPGRVSVGGWTTCSGGMNGWSRSCRDGEKPAGFKGRCVNLQTLKVEMRSWNSLEPLVNQCLCWFASLQSSHLQQSWEERFKHLNEEEQQHKACICGTDLTGSIFMDEWISLTDDISNTTVVCNKGENVTCSWWIDASSGM